MRAKLNFEALLQRARAQVAAAKNSNIAAQVEQPKEQSQISNKLISGSSVAAGRNALWMTQHDFLRALNARTPYGFSQSTLSRVERGKGCGWEARRLIVSRAVV